MKKFAYVAGICLILMIIIIFNFSFISQFLSNRNSGSEQGSGEQAAGLGSGEGQNAPNAEVPPNNQPAGERVPQKIGSIGVSPGSVSEVQINVG